MRNDKLCELRKRATLLIFANSFALFIRLFTFQSTCPVAILTFTMWSHCPVECECTDCNLYFDVFCKLLSPPKPVKKHKIAAMFINVLSSNSSFTDVNLVEFVSDLYAPSTMSASAVVEKPSSRQSVRPRRPMAAVIVPAELPWTFSFSPKLVVPTLDETICSCAMCIKHMLDPTPPPESPSHVAMPSPAVMPSPVARPLPPPASPSSSLPVAYPPIVARPSAVVASSSRAAAFTAPFDTPDIGCFACSP